MPQPEPLPDPEPSSLGAPSKRRGPTPASQSLGSGLGEESDPTLEIRTLIERLQQVSRVSRSKVEALETDNRTLASELERARAEINQHRDKEADLRAKFVEISSLLKERDLALQEAEQLRLRCEQQERDLALATRKAGESTQRESAATEAMQTALAQLTEARQQIASIRLARDTAQSLNLELSRKLAQAEDDAAEFDSQREDAQASEQRLAEDLTELHRRFEATQAERDDALASVSSLSEQLDGARQKLLDLTTDRAADQEAGSLHAEAMAEAQRQVLELGTERDAARQRSHEQALELDELRTQILELRAQPAQPAIAPEALEELQRQLKAMSAERDLFRTREEQLAQETLLQQEHLAELSGHISAIQQSQADALAALEASRQETARICAERDEQALEHSAATVQLIALRARMEELESAAQSAAQTAQLGDPRELARRLDAQRLQGIELGVQLSAAQREVLELTAHLAEARLAARFAANRTPRPSEITAPTSPRSAMRELGEALSEMIEDPASGPAPMVNEALSERAAKSGIAAMKASFQGFQKNPSDPSLLNELYSHAYAFSERAGVSGMAALHRLSATLADLAHDLYQTPARISASTLRTIPQTIEFLATLLRDQTAVRLWDPSKVGVYMINESPASAQAIQGALGRWKMDFRSSHDPAVALSELGEDAFQLIVISSELPGMDGFDLCTQIRHLPLHATTPVVFLTSSPVLESTLPGSPQGLHDFTAQPLNEHEFALKALNLLLKAQVAQLA